MAKHILNTNEWFSVIKGTVKLVLEDIQSGERKELILGIHPFMTVKVPKNIAHAIKNIGDEIMYLLAIADQPYDREAPDTYPYEVLL